MTRYLALLSLTFCLQAKTPNLTGTWKLNAEQSSLAGPTPQSLIYKVNDSAEALRINSVEIDSQGKQETNELTFDRSGKETLNHVRDIEMRTKLSDDEDGLREVSSFKGPSVTFTRKSKTTLSKDGKKMTMDALYTSDNGETPIKLVFDRQ